MRKKLNNISADSYGEAKDLACSSAHYSEGNKSARKKKETAKYDPFISGRLTEIIKAHTSEIKEVCERRPGIEEFTQDEWKQMDYVVLEVLKAMADARFKSHYMRMTPLKHTTPYSLSCKVREEQSKKFIIGWIDRIGESQELIDAVEWDAHCCWEIFCHLAIMIAENSKQQEVAKIED